MGPTIAVEVTIHDLMAKNQLRGVGRRYLWQKSLEICRQECIYYHILGGMVGFEFKNPYKLRVSVQQRTLCTLEFLSRVVRCL